VGVDPCRGINATPKLADATIVCVPICTGGTRLCSSLDDPPGIVLRGQVGKDERELVPAQPRHGIGLAHRIAEAFRDLDEQRIAGVVPERVVHALEAVEIDEHQGAQSHRLSLGVQQPGQPLQHDAPVVQAGQRIAFGLLLDLPFGELELGDVGADPDDVARPRQALLHL